MTYIMYLLLYHSTYITVKNLETFAVDNSGARFVIFFLGDPHSLESREGSKDGATNPYGVFSLRRSNDLNLDSRGSQSCNFLLHTISNTRVHSGTARQYIVGEEILTNINIAPHDGIEDSFVNAYRFHTQERRLEKGFGSPEAFITNSDDLTVRKLV